MRRYIVFIAAIIVIGSTSIHAQSEVTLISEGFEIKSSAGVMVTTPQVLVVSGSIYLGKEKQFERKNPGFLARKNFAYYSGIALTGGYGVGGGHFGLTYFSFGTTTFGDNGGRIGVNYYINNDQAFVLKNEELVGVHFSVSAFDNYEFRLGALKAVTDKAFLPLFGIAYNIGPKLL